jgi:hypothetical protein
VRTTLTIDDDVAEALRERAHRNRRSFKETVNEALRAGLASAGAGRGRNRVYRLKPASLGGVRPGFNLDKALALSDDLEDEGIARKLEMRK